MSYSKAWNCFPGLFFEGNTMNSLLVGFMSLFLISNSVAMEQVALQVAAAWMDVKSTHHTTYTGLLQDDRKIEINVCTKQRQTRNANPYELHYSGRIDKKRLTRADARKLVKTLIEAKKFTSVHPTLLCPLK